MNAPARVAGAVLAGLLSAPAVLADWTAHADFSACPRKYYPNLSGQEAPVATEAECRAQIDRAKRGDSAVCIRYSCIEGAGGGAAASAAPGHELDSTIERAISAGASGQISGTDAAALVGVGILGNALLAGMSAEEQQRRQQQAEAARQQAAEQARQRDLAEEQRKNRLLGEMQGVEYSGELELMTDDGGPQLMTDDAGAGGELALMGEDDSARDIMGRRKAPPAARQQPPATRISLGPYNPGAKAPAGGPSGNPGAPAQTLAMNTGPNPQANPKQQARPDAHNKGRVDGQACNQRTAGSLCGGLDAQATSTCVREYNEGYDKGARLNEQDLKAKGAAAGTKDKGKANAAFAYAEARGSCGNIFVQAYNNAFRQR